MPHNERLHLTVESRGRQGHAVTDDRSRWLVRLGELPNIALPLTSGGLVVARLRARHLLIVPLAAERGRWAA
jgi:hypothetical protein